MTEPCDSTGTGWKEALAMATARAEAVEKRQCVFLEPDGSCLLGKKIPELERALTAMTIRADVAEKGREEDAKLLNAYSIQEVEWRDSLDESIVENDELQQRMEILRSLSVGLRKRVTELERLARAVAVRWKRYIPCEPGEGPLTALVAAVSKSNGKYGEAAFKDTCRK